MSGRRVSRALAVGALAACTACSPAADGNGHDDADVTFATAMVPHHQQGVAMARLAVHRAASADVRALARQIDAEQMPEIVALQGLMADWGRPAATASSMPGMSGMSDMTGAPQEGDPSTMMTDAQMRDLDAASGAAFDRLFLQMMIRHHGAGVEMARTELSDGENADARQLAQNISDSQQAQTSLMLQMLSG